MPELEPRALSRTADEGAGGWRGRLNWASARKVGKAGDASGCRSGEIDPRLERECQRKENSREKNCGGAGTTKIQHPAVF